MKPKADAKRVQVSHRIRADVFGRLEELVAHLSREMGINVNRSQVIEMAVNGLYDDRVARK